ncbi:MAG: alanine--tRNA ligase [Bacteroidales bacterium]|jgi:alanyl-tRNA synthetase|nr:alanine--tRNA ligase [Bacteroidales bacterium]
MMTSQQIRKAFLDFFASKQHTIVPSAPMVVKNDPTLMFTNAGMNQFKDIFLGNISAESPRVADTQKCLRVSGKHNDLEEVGHDTYHHTMFEMLGNWSFGDYFKKEAIAWAWEFLTEKMGISHENIYVTVFGGDKKDGLEADLEAKEFWKEHIDEKRIIFGSKKDNFWEMGDTGPCGPCSEIHIDIRSASDKAATSGIELVNQDHPQVIEIWNLVFIQFNRKADGSLVELPAKHVDTGMGFERLCMVLQNKQSNYDTDVFTPIINAIADKAGIAYGSNPKADIAMRVIADHVRAVSFAIADGQLPSNNKAGYVIRRILRRAVRYGYTFLNFREPFIYEIFDTLEKQMGSAFAELTREKKLISKVIQEEENTFLKTLENGIKHLTVLTQKAAGDIIDGEDAFVLYDTYGFPFDLTELILREQGLKVDLKGFEKAMQRQKARSREDANVETGDWTVLREGDHSVFVGYDSSIAGVQIMKYRKVVKKEKTLYQLVLDKTSFYAEMGGQTGDSGTLENNETGEKIKIFDTQKENELVVHWTTELPENVSAFFIAQVDLRARRRTEAHHSATHLMHFALRAVLGNHVEQKGSLVNADMLRFDFSHFQKMTPEEIRKVEKKVNEHIRQNFLLEEWRSMPVEEAKAKGAMAIFNEKYGNKVRVIKFGNSIELCGGTHARSTGNIGFFKILSEGAIAAGIRRIEAVAGEAAEQYIYSISDTLHNAKEMLKTPDLEAGIKRISEQASTLKKQFEAATKEKIVDRLEKILAMIKDDFVIVDKVESPEIMRAICTELRKKMPDGVFIAYGVFDGKAALHLFLGDQRTKQGFNASNIVKEVAPLISGNGGGQPFYAMITGTDINGLTKAVEKINQLLSEA